MEEIAALVTPIVEELGLEVVRISMLAQHGKTLQIMLERKDRSPITVDDCADASRAISPALDVADMIPDAFHLEVSSPGIDRPLLKLADYERFAGFDAKVEVKPEQPGRKRYRGKLAGIEDMIILVEDETETHRIDYRTIQKGKLILTDELIHAYQNERI